MSLYHTTDDLLLLSLDYGLGHRKAYRNHKGCATLFVSPRESGQFFCYAFCQEKSGESTGVTGFVSFFGDPTIAYGKEKKRKNI